MIQAVHKFDMGYSQTTRRITGIELAWREARKHSSPTCWILPPMPWDADQEAIAQLIHRNAPEAKVYCHSYSYGAGWAFIQFCKEMAKLDRRIALANLCDPVHRYPNALFFLKLLSLTQFPKITIPANVNRVRWVRQFNDTPAGHDLVVSSATAIAPANVVDAGHNQIDESFEFQSLVHWSVEHSLQESA